MLSFTEFKNKLLGMRTPSNERAYYKWGYRMNNPVRRDYNLEEINCLLRAGDPRELRELSRYYYRTSGIYRNAIDLISEMPKYDTIVTPIYSADKKVPKSQIVNVFYKACDFIDRLHVPVNFAKITREMMISGVYYGILRGNDVDGYTFQDLPITYCRSRFKDGNDLEVLEFNLNYFNTIVDLDERRTAVETFPPVVQKAYKNAKGNIKHDFWVELPAECGGISFGFGDNTPPLASSIPSIYQMDDAVERESARDERELRKLLIQQMPVDSKGELVFQLDEVAEIHASVAQMLTDTDTEVLTTFGETSLESLQDPTAATQSASRIDKYVTAAYNELGISQELFNCDTASGLEMAIKRQEAFVREILNIYSVWLKYQINVRFEKPKFSFDFEILPTTVYNQKEVQEKFFQGAQYGYSKMYAGVTLGIKQQNQISLMDFENDFLDMTNKMVPLQSTYTSSGKVEKDTLIKKSSQTEEKTVESQENSEQKDNSSDLNNSGEDSKSES